MLIVWHLKKSAPPHDLRSWRRRVNNPTFFSSPPFDVFSLFLPAAEKIVFFNTSSDSLERYQTFRHHIENNMKTSVLSSLALILSGSSNAIASGPASAAANAAKSFDYRYFVAGGVCAATSHGITTPIDVVKTKMQAEPDVYNEGMASACMSILKTDGPSALLGGLGPTVVGYGIEGAMKFGVYEISKPIMVNLIGGESNTFAFILASIMAGSVASILLCPMESARIRVVTDPEYKGMGLLQTLPKLINESGLLNLFAGIYAMLSKQVPYTMAKQVSFDIVATFLYQFLNGKGLKAEDMKWVVSVLSAFVASIFACISSQPGDMILTETYKNANGASFFGVIMHIFNTKGGVSGFFTGTGARIVHVSSIITSQLVIYDIVKQALGLPATGSH
jgi:solute carrier family 25 phosphate transporter 3